jgi:hypothetical protein
MRDRLHVGALPDARKRDDLDRHLVDVFDPYAQIVLIRADRAGGAGLAEAGRATVTSSARCTPFSG